MADLRIFLCLMVLHGGTMLGQQATFQVSADRDSVGLGELVTLTLSSDAPLEGGRHWSWPDLNPGDSLPQGWEILKVGPLDSSASTAFYAGMVRTQRIEVLAWDTGFKVIEPFVLKPDDDGESVRSQPLLIQVGLIPLEDNPAPQPMQGYHAFEWTWWEWLTQHLSWILALLAAGAAIWWWMRRKPAEQEATIAEPEPTAEPGHMAALRILRQLHVDRPWMRGEEKATQAQLSQALRLHLDSAFGVKSLERTTTDLAHQLQHVSIRGMEPSDVAWLTDLLMRSDLVKFAKQTMPADAHERAVRDALNWVERTQPAPVSDSTALDPNAPKHHG